MGLGSVSKSATEKIAEGNPAGLLYGMIITAAVLSATAGHVAGVGGLVVAAVFVLVVYWIADVYVRAFAYHFTQDQVPLWRRLGSAARHESRVLLGGVPALAALLLATLFGADQDTAVYIALWVTVVELGTVGYLAARRVGANLSTALGEAAVASLLGVVMIVAKRLLH